MAQFDFWIILPLLYSLFLTLTIYYYVFIKTKIPNYFEIKKFRTKIQDSVSFYLFLNHNKQFLSFKTSYNKIFL